MMLTSILRPTADELEALHDLCRSTEEGNAFESYLTALVRSRHNERLETEQDSETIRLAYRRLRGLLNRSADRYLPTETEVQEFGLSAEPNLS